MTPGGQEAGDAGTVRTRALDSECVNLILVPRPPFQLPIAGRIRRCAAFTQANTLPVNGHRHTRSLVRVNSNNYLNSWTAIQTGGYCHDHLLKDVAKMARRPGERSRLR